MTRILCDMTGCKHNGSCCLSTANKSYCTKEEVHFTVDEAMCQLECSNFEESMEKEVECRNCQIQKYGGIKLQRKINFEHQPIDKFSF